MSPDGTILLFESTNSLTSYQTDGNTELYRYQAGSGDLQCVSCDPSGAAPTTSVDLMTDMAANDPNISQVSLESMPQNLSASGDQVFFESSDPLVGQATDGVSNVYEWEADGAGSCQSTAQDGGCIYLISSGKSPEGSYFGGASADGSNVFFFTDQGLVGQDQDTLYDVYDARVDGGFVTQNPAAATSCTGEACRSAGTSPGAAPPVATVSFNGSQQQSVKVVIKHHRVRGGRVRVDVKVFQAGAIRLDGPDGRTVSRRVRSAGTYGLTMTLTRRTKRSLVAGRSVRLAITVRFTPASGRPRTAHATIKVEA